MTQEPVRILYVPSPACCGAAPGSADRKLMEALAEVEKEYGPAVDVDQGNSILAENVFYRMVRETNPSAWRAVQEDGAALVRLFPLVVVGRKVVWTGIESPRGLRDAIKAAVRAALWTGEGPEGMLSELLQG